MVQLSKEDMEVIACRMNNEFLVEPVVVLRIKQLTGPPIGKFQIEFVTVAEKSENQESCESLVATKS